MQTKSITQALREHRDLFSKLTDGLLAAAILVLLWLTISLAVRPISAIFGPPGLLIYVLGLLAVSMFSLQQSLVAQRNETLRAWYGVAGGFLAWSVIEVITYLGVPLLPNLAGVVLLIMVALIVFLLWRFGLPLGARFFALTFLLNWVGQVFIMLHSRLAYLSPIFRLTFLATGVVSVLGVVVTLFWLLFQTHRRIQRLGAAVMIWFLVSMALYVFRGSLF